MLLNTNELMHRPLRARGVGAFPQSGYKPDMTDRLDREDSNPDRDSEDCVLRTEDWV